MRAKGYRRLVLQIICAVFALDRKLLPRGLLLLSRQKSPAGLRPTGLVVVFFFKLCAARLLYLGAMPVMS
ncbi:MAG: hypothetical protein RSD82_04610 [Comamonas sp.]